MSKRSAITKYTPDCLWPVFQRLLPEHVLQNSLTRLSGQHCPKRGFYLSLFPPLVVLWGFIYQRLQDNHSCDTFLSAYLLQERSSTRHGPHPKPPSENSGGYCKARQRLPVALAQEALTCSAEALSAEWGAAGLWHSWRVVLMDGSTLRLAAQAPLLEEYGTPSNQHGPSHWPTLRLVAGFDLFCGSLWGVAEGAYRLSEHRLSLNLIRSLGDNFLYVADRNFGVYHILQGLHAAAAQGLLRLKVTQARRLGGQRLCPGCDLDVVWQPSQYDTLEEDLPAPAIAGRLIYVRLEKKGFRPIDLYLFTTLTDREAYPASELVALYGQRWQAELSLRHLKTTLDMEHLTGKSVAMVRKELLLGLLAYNLIRGLIGKAAQRSHHLPLELSFAACLHRIVETLSGWSTQATPAESKRRMEALLERLGRCVRPKRKLDRFEPRAVWGKPKVYPTIKVSRDFTRQAQLEKL